MADEISPALLAELLPLLRRQELDKARVGGGEHGLPYMPPLNRPSEARSATPEADRALEAMGLPASMAPMVAALLKGEPYTREFTGVPQLQRAGSAVGDALIEPSIPNATHAAVQTAASVARPALAVKSMLGGLGAAAVQDVGGVFSEADAQAPLTRRQQREMEMARQQREGQAAIDQRASETVSRLKREEADASAQRELDTSAKAKERDEYDRAVARAEAGFKEEMDNDLKFNKTTVGQTWNKMGGLGPALMGLVGSGFANAAGRSLPWQLGSGTLTGALSANLPLIDAVMAPAENPKRRAYERMAEELPPNHPRRQEYFDYAEKKLSRENPARKIASEEYWAHLPERLAIGGAEGFAGALLGSDVTEAVMRAGRGIAERALGRSGGQPTSTLAGTVVHDAPASTAGAAPSAALVKALSEGEGHLPAAASASSQRPTYKGHPLPPGMALNKNGEPYNLGNGAPTKRFFKE